jgi:hypothetical protein
MTNEEKFAEAERLQEAARGSRPSDVMLATARGVLDQLERGEGVSDLGFAALANVCLRMHGYVVAVGDLTDFVARVAA